MKLLDGDVDWDPDYWGAEYEDKSERWVDELGFRITYQSWGAETTRVVSGPYGQASFPGQRFPDRRSARLHWHLRAGIVEEYRIPGRWIFRIRRV